MSISLILYYIYLCLRDNRTRAMQDLIRCLRTEEHISRFMLTLSHVALLLTKSTNANHVILFSFNHFSPSQSRVSISSLFLQLFFQHFVEFVILGNFLKIK